MIRYQKLAGVSVENSALPRITFTPEGKAMGSVPGWSVMIDPDYVVNGAPRNRAKSRSITQTPEGAISVGSFSNGESSFEFNAPTVGIRRIDPKVAINKSSWTVFFVLELSSGIETLVNLATSNTHAIDGLLSMRVVITGGNEKDFSILEGASISRVRYTPETPFAGRKVLLMATFSTANGLSLFENGTLVKENKLDKRPLDQGDGIGEWSFFNSSIIDGNGGICGSLDTDLSAPEHTGHRRAIEKFLMNKYGIVG